MFKQIQVTLYDLFGYLMPGTIFLVATAILLWTVVFPIESVTVVGANGAWCIFGLSSVGIIRLGWWLIVLLAYFSGHMAQAIGNVLVGCIKSIDSLKLSLWQIDEIPEPIMTLARLNAVSMFGSAVKNIDSLWLYRLCDASIAQCGSIEDRELYQHREGFYRGLTVAFLMLGLSVSLRAIVPGASFQTEQNTFLVPFVALVFLILISLVGVLLSFLRYRRFYSYRVTSAILGFITLPKKRTLEATKVKSKQDKRMERR